MSVQVLPEGFKVKVSSIVKAKHGVPLVFLSNSRFINKRFAQDFKASTIIKFNPFRIIGL